jgi:hypothetical protein
MYGKVKRPIVVIVLNYTAFLAVSHITDVQVSESDFQFRLRIFQICVQKFTYSLK